ncbi:family 16 glycosylhydrolase [Bradyrhizobium sp. Ce-3]|uniref:glycoside hydrolase family 16 protein n=1 Tax=Bradyrhizobium sp. Ce-3 TaxID=2913970 RepID=UPI001FBB6563|nr:glycoside hydrolase family 16 protein [Bradyrhizobium sp. Ce-3]GKQ49662.1 hypothetical protein BRSPCE3_05160 [Bradyrhizobium sp. Ce-3]
MALAAPAGFTSSNLVFQESFTGTTLDSYWHNYITSRAANGWAWNSYGAGGSGPGGPYDADYDMPSQVTVSNGVLNLTAVKQSVTGKNQGTVQSFPITSGAVSSYGNLEFDGGYLQISMKAPSGDGAWPGLWLMPGAGSSSGDNFEIDIQEGGYTGNGPANQAFTWHLHTPSGTVGGTVNTGIDLTAGFHTYGINWVPGQSITWYLDGRQIATVTSAQVPIPNEPMQLIMSNQVANSNAAGWHTALDSSTPSSMPMQIDEIQLYRAAGSAGSVTGANVTGSTTPTTPSQPTTPTILPAVTQVTASPGTGIKHTGDAVTFTVGFNEVVNVTGTPTLSLSDGGTATYVSGSGTSALTFRTTIAQTDLQTAALAITGLNLPGTASIKDASGATANLAGAVKTFTGLQVSPTTVTAPPTSPVAPVLMVADTSLSVDGGGGTVDLGLKVTTADPNDSVSVTIKGLPRYETITDNLDGRTYRGGRDITLTAAQVDSGLTLQSNYRGTDRPVATLAITATATDPTTGVRTYASSSITVTDPPPSTATNTVANQNFALLSQYLASHQGSSAQGQLVMAAAQGGGWNEQSYLTKPQH